MSSIASIQDIEHRFTYHAPKAGQPEKYQAIREQAKSLALMLDKECPPSRELSLALTNLEQCVFWANAAIARFGECESKPVEIVAKPCA